MPPLGDGTAEERELTQPPVLPALPDHAENIESDPVKEHLPVQRAAANSGTSHMQALGVVGSHRPTKTPMIDELAREGSAVDVEGGVEPSRRCRVLGLCHRLMVFHTSRLLADRAWCEAYVAAAEHVAKTTVSSPPTAAMSSTGERPRVCALGLGSGVPALAAARAGAEVTWVLRVERLAQIARRLAAANGLQKQVTVVRVREWADLESAAGEGGGEPNDGEERLVELSGDSSDDAAALAVAAPSAMMGTFDAVLTEEMDDALLSEGVLELGRLARRSLLKPGGVFAPHRATLKAMLLSVRTQDVSGFDLRGFNAFAGGRAFVSDIGEVESKEGGVLTRLSEAVTLCDLWLGGFLGEEGEGGEMDAAATDGPLELATQLTACAGGLFNFVAVWYVLHLPGGVTIDLGPPASPADGLTSSRAHVEANGAALPYTMRARAQRLHYMGYERRLRAGEIVPLRMRRDERTISVSVPLDPTAEAKGDLVRWPVRNSLGYHFSMIADTTRNGCFDRAIVRALSQSAAAREHVLDIGAGSGLLAMMSVRAGATRVSSLEMVPAMAAVARHCVAANGMADAITVHEIKSTDVEASALGGKAALLVCELVDNELLGEGTLYSIADARRRLLTPGARVVPRGGVLFALPIEMKVPRRGKLNLDELKLLYTDAAFREGNYSNDGRKMQLLGDDEWMAIGEPLRLFDFDWEAGDLDTLCDERVVTRRLRCTVSGVLNAFVLYFHLHCDGEEENHMSTGPDDAPFPTGGPPTHWDQALRYLPVEVRVTKGQRLDVTARHTDSATQIAVRDVEPCALSKIGHPDHVLGGARLTAGAATCGTVVQVKRGVNSTAGGGGKGDAKDGGGGRSVKSGSAATAIVTSHKASVKRAKKLLYDLEAAWRAGFNPGLAVLVVTGHLPPEQLRQGGTPAGQADLLELLAELASPSLSVAAVHEALRGCLTPNEQLIELARSCEGGRWLVAKEVYAAKLFASDTRIRREVILVLRDKLKLYSREEWADAFGLPFWASFPVHRVWGAVTHSSHALSRKALVARPRESTKDFTLLEMLTLGRPGLAEGWASPFAWFARGTVHHGEVLTTESAEALASYLATRYRQLGGKGSILEVFAGNGRLAHHLNATGFMPTPVIACDPQPIPTPSHPKGGFDMQKCTDLEAIAEHAPVTIVVCSWLHPSIVDPTPNWRRARVPEYLMLGEVADPALPYNAKHPGYEREVISEVSRHMLHLSDGMPDLCEQRGGVGVCCCASFRRKA